MTTKAISWNRDRQIGEQFSHRGKNYTIISVSDPIITNVCAPANAIFVEIDADFFEEDWQDAIAQGKIDPTTIEQITGDRISTNCTRDCDEIDFCSIDGVIHGFFTSSEDARIDWVEAKIEANGGNIVSRECAQNDCDDFPCIVFIASKQTCHEIHQSVGISW